MIEKCKGLNYENRLMLLILTTLETRRIRADFIEIFNILNGLESLEESAFFRGSEEVTWIKHL